MRRLATFAALCLGVVVLPIYADEQISELVYIGTHGAGQAPQEQDASSIQGIYAARLDVKTGHLSPLGIQAQLERATWLVTHPRLPVIYTVADSGGGPSSESNIHSFAIDGTSGKLTPINQVSAGGIDATHLGIDAASKTLFVASFRSGTLTALPLEPDGSLGNVVSTQKEYGTGPHPRQKMPVAHGVAVDPSHRYVWVADFGADRIFVYHFDAATRTLSPAEPPYESAPSGSGPRHLVVHPSGHFLYLDTELSAELLAYRWDEKQGHLDLLQTLAPYPAADSGKDKSAGEIALSADGKFLYLSLRGDQDSIVAYAVDKRSGKLEEIQRIASHGKSPWSFGIDPTGRWMLVTNEGSNAVAVFSVDRATGALTATDESLSIPRPVTVAFYAH